MRRNRYLNKNSHASLGTTVTVLVATLCYIRKNVLFMQKSSLDATDIKINEPFNKSPEYVVVVAIIKSLTLYYDAEVKLKNSLPSIFSMFKLITLNNTTVKRCIDLPHSTVVPNPNNVAKQRATESNVSIYNYVPNYSINFAQ
jgi:hypothetical protein